jgi:hypothetical protein
MAGWEQKLNITCYLNALLYLYVVKLYSIYLPKYKMTMLHKRKGKRNRVRTNVIEPEMGKQQGRGILEWKTKVKCR